MLLLLLLPYDVLLSIDLPRAVIERAWGMLLLRDLIVGIVSHGKHSHAEIRPQTTNAGSLSVIERGCLRHRSVIFAVKVIFNPGLKYQHVRL